jgi:hypothetical protein
MMGNVVNPEWVPGRQQVVENHLQWFNAHDLDGLVETFGSEASLTLNGDSHAGRAGIRGLYGLLFSDFPDLRMEPRRFYPSHEAVVAELTLQATRGRAIRGVAPGRLEVPVCALFRFDAEGRLAEVSYYFDGVLLLQQMGQIPLAA